MFDALAAHATTAMTLTPLPADMKNPLDGLTPDFTVFGTKFDSAWKKLLTGVWAIFVLLAIYYLMRGIVGIAQHRNGAHPGQLRESRQEAVSAGIALGLLVALPVVVGVIIAVVS